MKLDEEESTGGIPQSLLDKVYDSTGSVNGGNNFISVTLDCLGSLTK